jgi:hypothetical protein
MDESNQTQKEVGQKYRNNLGYFRVAPFMARERFYLSILAVLLGAYAIIRLEIVRTDEVYNPAPLSISHAYLEGNCAACHNLAARNIFHSAQGGAADAPDPKGDAPSPAIHSWSGMRPAVFTSSLMINQSCQSCHAGMDLHQPTSETIALEAFHSELHIATATGCFSCHQEHLGRIDLKLPGDTACAACHNDAAQMAASFMQVPLSGTTSNIAFHGITPDGVSHFIPPERKAPLPLFTSFEHGHPAFEYEQPGLKDPDPLSFSHKLHLHLQSGEKLSCVDCHKPAADGIYYQKVTYEAACERCHNLQFDESNPELLIPHGSVARLGSFLNSLPYQYRKLDQTRAAAQGGSATLADQNAFANKQILALLQRLNVQKPLGTPPSEIFGQVEHQILFTADPYVDRPPIGNRPYFSGCAYCHQVTEGAGGGDAVVTPPQMADRWLAHGAFTHAKHTMMSCVQCHKAEDSREATDVIMPSQASCVTCHRTEGSAPSNCLACHSFHSPQSVVKDVKEQLQKMNLPPTAACPAMGQMSSFLVSDRHTSQ